MTTGEPTTTEEALHESGAVSHRNVLGKLDESASKEPQRKEAPAPPSITPPSEVDSLAFVMDVPVELTVEIGRRRMTIAEMLKLAPGSVLELDTAAGEPLSVYVNNRIIARGEAVVVGDRYGVRILEIMIEDQKAKAGGAK